MSSNPPITVKSFVRTYQKRRKGTAHTLSRSCMIHSAHPNRFGRKRTA